MEGWRSAALPVDHRRAFSWRSPRATETTGSRSTALSRTGPPYLSGGSGADAIVGGSHADSIYGNAGDDRLDGAGGDDEFFGFTGADELHGGPGVDTARYSTQGPLNVTLDDLPDDGMPGEGDNARQDVENVHAGGGRPIRIVGSDAANRLESEEGVAELVGGAGDDRLIARFGRAGSLIGGPGRDVLQPPRTARSTCATVRSTASGATRDSPAGRSRTPRTG